MADINWHSFTSNPTSGSSAPVDWHQFTPKDMTDPGTATQSVDMKTIPAAVVGGLSSGGADIAEGIADTPTFIMHHLHIISPETAAKLYQASKENTDMFRPESGDSSDPFKQAQQQHPIIEGGAKIATDIAGMAGGMRSISGATAGIPAIAGIPTRAAGLGLINAAATNPEDKGSAFLQGAATSPMFDLAGAAASAAGNKINAVNTISKTLGETKPETVNKAFDVVRNTPFKPEDQASSYTLGQKIQNYLEQNKGSLYKSQVNALDDTSQKLINAGNHDDTMKALQTLGSKTPLFSGLKASDALYNDVNQFKTGISDIINNATQREGLGPDALNKATQLYKQQDIMSNIFSKMPDDISKFNFDKAHQQVNAAIRENINKPYMSDTVQSLQGLQKTLKTVAHGYSPGSLVSTAIGGVVGGGIGEKEGGMKGAGIGTIAGMIGGNYAIHALKNMINYPAGQAILKWLGNDSTSMQDTSAFVKALSSAGISENLNQMHKTGDSQ